MKKRAMKLKRNKKLLKFVCRDAGEDIIHFKYKWRVQEIDVPTTLIQAALAFLNSDKETLKEIVEVLRQEEKEHDI